MTCACLSDNGEVARNAIQRGEQLGRPVDESHFSITFLRCRDCGQAFIRVFTELIDWADGEDPQRWVYCPLDSKELERLNHEALRPEDVVALGLERRMLIFDFPKGQEATFNWLVSRLWIAPHD